jgi:hypothetical protein
MFFLSNVMLSLVLFGAVQAQSSCRCTCCSGNSCTATLVGTVSVAACSSCTGSLCTSNFPSSCPASGSSGVNSASCSSGTTTSPSSGPTVWSGNYQVTSTCSTGTCCCVTGSFSLLQSGTQVSGTFPLTGNCGGASTFPAVINLASATSTSASVNLNGQTLNIVKSGTTVTLSNVQFPQCSGTATCNSGDCTGSSTTCFHESTMVTYNGQTLSLAQIQASSNDRLDCKVPHIVRARGVIIETSCNRALRLTSDHLVYSSKGLMAASSLITGDVLFSDLDQLHPCKVIRISNEQNDQTYFGLNCAESIVLANGIKTSTFGKYHTIPAFWMKYASKIFGIERASSIGDSLVSVLIKMNVI